MNTVYKRERVYALENKVTPVVLKNKKKLRPWVITVLWVLGLYVMMSMMMIVFDKEIVYEYEEVYIGEGGSAFAACDSLNDDVGVDIREIVYEFKRVNNLNNAGNIQKGYYLVPIVKDIK